MCKACHASNMPSARRDRTLLLLLLCCCCCRCCHAAGVSVQVVDDILDFTQTAEQLGKPQGQDLASGNLTAPVIYALQQSPELEEIIQSELWCTVGCVILGDLSTACVLGLSSGGDQRPQEWGCGVAYLLGERPHAQFMAPSRHPLPPGRHLCPWCCHRCGRQLTNCVSWC